MEVVKLILLNIIFIAMIIYFIMAIIAAIQDYGTDSTYENVSAIVGIIGFAFLTIWIIVCLIYCNIDIFSNFTLIYF